jgi:hypothetical protein
MSTAPIATAIPTFSAPDIAFSAVAWIVGWAGTRTSSASLLFP